MSEDWDLSTFLTEFKKSKEAIWQGYAVEEPFENFFDDQKFKLLSNMLGAPNL